ncbi:hypothetical protein [Terribacillus saccharophilus]|uniref:hypothetical protein n=1 Tax=Terribacillus saccharophilus TaxID=361277 RepID=UPI000BA72423|nr:hypothetical protein [Terribacillus saccharophilus]PAF19739.1 hypothetical protein CHH51_01365 [Terribacillus saccharophilus]
MNTARKTDVMPDAEDLIKGNIAIDSGRMVAEVPLVDGMIYTVVAGDIKAVFPPESGFGNYNICFKDGQPFDITKSDKQRF